MAVLIKAGTLSPIPPGADLGICVECSDKSARWIFRRQEDWCAHCFLTKTGWAKDNRVAIIELANAVQAKIGKPMLDDNGDILHEESDRILSSIVFVSSYKYGKELREK